MITLWTKDSSRVGNAILYGGDISQSTGDLLFLVETDFGNKMRLLRSELIELFDVGNVVSYADWSAYRASLVLMEPL